MSAANASIDGSKAASKRKKKSKKKANGQHHPESVTAEPNGSKESHEAEEDEDDDAVSHPSKKGLAPPPLIIEDSLHMPSSPPEATSPADQQQPVRSDAPLQPSKSANLIASEGSSDEEEGEDEEDESSVQMGETTDESTDTAARLDAIQQERDSLRAEVTQLRRSLESLQEKHTEELTEAKEELSQSEKGKENAETQYRNLLGKVNTIRSQLGERLKADAAELEQARERIEELETSNNAAREENGRLQVNVSKLNDDIHHQTSEIETLRSRANASTSNWASERDELVSNEAFLREEYEVAKQAMQDWEILATEERSRRQALEDGMQELEEQLSGQREAFERAQREAETQSSTVDGLQRALRDLQEERKRELRELVEQSQGQLEALRAQTKSAADASAELRSQLETTQHELERTAPFEKEAKEKNLLIGKLRHEAVILNDHLTKALRFLKRGKPEDNVDRQIVTNHFLHFLQLDRSDPKKFQVLQLIAALLGWDEQQREQAGLLRQGSGFANAGGSLRVPVSPFRRTPSTPVLNSDFNPVSPTGESKESLAELWSDFLEREAEAGGSQYSGRTGRAAGRSPSLASQAGFTSPASEQSAWLGRTGTDSKKKESSTILAGLGLGRTETGGSVK